MSKVLSVLHADGTNKKIDALIDRLIDKFWPYTCDVGGRNLIKKVFWSNQTNGVIFLYIGPRNPKELTPFKRVQQTNAMHFR